MHATQLKCIFDGKSCPYISIDFAFYLTFYSKSIDVDLNQSSVDLKYEINSNIDTDIRAGFITIIIIQRMIMNQDEVNQRFWSFVDIHNLEWKTMENIRKHWKTFLVFHVFQRFPMFSIFKNDHELIMN